MNKILIVTVLATDRPGIVNTLSETLVAHNANWIDSRMSNLADKFAGLLKISVPTDQLVNLKEALQSLHNTDNQLHILMDEAASSAPRRVTTPLSVELIGTDQPGIIDNITHVLARLNVNIRELQSELREASMSSEILFWANLQLGLPDGISHDDVQDELEKLSEQLMVDINVGD